MTGRSALTPTFNATGAVIQMYMVYAHVYRHVEDGESWKTDIVMRGKPVVGGWGRRWGRWRRLWRYVRWVREVEGGDCGCGSGWELMFLGRDSSGFWVWGVEAGVEERV